MKTFSASIISSGYFSSELRLQTALILKLHDQILKPFDHHSLKKKKKKKSVLSHLICHIHHRATIHQKGLMQGGQ